MHRQRATYPDQREWMAPGEISLRDEVNKTHYVSERRLKP